MPYLECDGVKIYYEVHMGNGPALLLSHGYSATSGMWAGQISALSKHFKLITWDMRGHGKSDYPSDPAAYSEAHTIKDMETILDETCGSSGRAIVGGFSLGGYMSLAFYRVYPMRVLALLIIDSGPGFKKEHAREQWNRMAFTTGKKFEKEGLQALQGASPEKSPVSHRDAKGLALAARGMLAQQNSQVFYSLPNVKVPSLIVVGADDTVFLAASEYMAKKIPGARRVVVPKAGHAVNEQPERFLEAVTPFLEEVRNGWREKAGL